jgi:hypothetical protein
MSGLPEFLVSEIDRRNFELLIESLKDGRRASVAIVGSGLSRECGYASWDELVRGIALQAGIVVEAETSDPESRAQSFLRIIASAYAQYSQHHPETAATYWIEDVAKFVAPRTTRPFSDSHLAIVRTNFSRYVTTNYDPSISLSAAKAGHELVPAPYRRGLLFPHGGGVPGRRYLYHVHGRLWSEQGERTHEPIVFLPREYDEAYGHAGDGPVANLLLPILENDHLVAIGFGMQDPNLVELMRRCAGNEALRRLMDSRRDAGRQHPSYEQQWFRLEGLPEDDPMSEKECARRHAQPEFFSLIHYRYLPKDDPVRWGLDALLAELAQLAPVAASPTAIRTTVEISATAGDEDLSPDVGTAATPVDSVISPSSGPMVEIGDFLQVLRRIEEILEQGP